MEHALLLIARWIGLAHDAWRAARATRRPLAAEIDSLHEQVGKIKAENDLLRSRLLRLNGHTRPHYRPWERLQILWHRGRYGMSLRATCRAFIVSLPTLCSWLKGTREGVRRLVHARPPVRGISDLAREIAWHLKREWPKWGTRRIAGILARLGLKGSRTSVQRILRHPSRRPAKSERAPRPLPRARAPRHMYVVDFTLLRGMFRSIVVGAVMDLYSRKVLTLRVSPKEPDAAFAVSLLRTAVRRHGKPRWIISDRGRQFSSRLFGAFLKRRRIRHRWGAVGRPGAPTLDRWWRTLKEEYARGLMLYLPIASLERKLSGYAAWYNVERPNSGLRLRTPEEVFRESPARKKRRVEAGELFVDFMGGDRRLPVFRLRRAA